MNSVNDKSSNVLILSPNPATDFITINMGSIGACSNGNNNGASPIASITSIEIYDVMGVEMQTTPSATQPPLQEGNLRLDISNHPAGVYFVKIVGRNGAFAIVEKFIIIQ